MDGSAFRDPGAEREEKDLTVMINLGAAGEGNAGD
jgi:hypothetical protein